MKGTLTSSDVTRLLSRWSEGDADALHRLMPLVLEDLQRQARRYLEKESSEHTLQPTALVNELYLKLRGRRTVTWRNREHFFGFAAQAMRMILVDHARARKTSKRGDGIKPLPLDEALKMEEARDDQLIALDEVLDELAAVDKRQAQIVELRFYVGLTVEQVARVMKISAATVKREWASAKVWLAWRMAANKPPPLDQPPAASV